MAVDRKNKKWSIESERGRWKLSIGTVESYERLTLKEL